MEFSEGTVVPDTRPGKPGVAFAVEEGVVSIYRAGSPTAFVALADLKAAMDELL